MQIFTLICTLILLFSPIFFWQYILYSFPSLGVGRRQFLLGIFIGALTTLPLFYSDIWILWRMLDNIFFSLLYILEGFLWFWLVWSLGLFFSLFFGLSCVYSYYRNKKVPFYILRLFGGFLWLVLFFSCLIYVTVFILWTWSGWEIVESWDFVFQGFAMIFWYYIIVSLLEEGLKYFWNMNLTQNKNHFYIIIWYACVIGLGFAFFENILYSYNYYQNQASFDGIFQLVFFRSVFTVSVHILCAIVLAGALYIYINTPMPLIKTYITLIGLWWISIFSHAFFNIALTYGYMWYMFFYLFALYIAVVYLTSHEW